MEKEQVLIAFALTLFAGLSTGIGSAIGLFTKRADFKLLSAAMGFSAGVMIYISFTELLGEAFNSLTHSFGEKNGSWITIISFFGGILLIGLIDKLVPEYENPHEFDHTDDLGKDESEILKSNKHKKLLRTGLFTALAIAIHNFPEGMATFAGALQDLSLGIPIAIAIAIHNVPEGLAVSVPIYYATGNRRRAFWYSFLSGLAEPLGAIVGYFLFLQFFTEAVFGIVYAGIAGVMVFIALDQLLPAAEEYGSHHITVYGLISGMALMAVSLVLFI